MDSSMYLPMIRAKDSLYLYNYSISNADKNIQTHKIIKDSYFKGNMRYNYRLQCYE